MSCKGIFGRLFGHDYQPRYSFGKPTYDANAANNVFSMVFSRDLPRVIASSRPKTYHGDVCTRCGDTIKPTAPQPADEG